MGEAVSSSHPLLMYAETSTKREIDIVRNRYGVRRHAKLRTFRLTGSNQIYSCTVVGWTFSMVGQFGLQGGEAVPLTLDGQIYSDDPGCRVAQ